MFAKRHKASFLILCLVMVSLFTQGEVLSEEFPDRSTEYEFVAYTIPKSGSHLLDCSIRLMTGRVNYFFNPPKPLINIVDCKNRIDYLNSIHRYEMSHLPFHQGEMKLRQDLNCKILFTVRDPRDVVLSFKDYIEKGFVLCPWERKNWSKMTEDEKILFVIEKVHGVGIRQIFERRLPWGNSHLSYTVKFENLVGEKGGGTREAQMTELSNIADHIGVNISDGELNKVSENLFGWGGTFNKGKIGRWKGSFNELQKQRCKDLFGDIIILLGYEEDNNW